MANTKVTGDVIANGTISTVHLADDAITAAKLDSTATGITFADLTVDTDTLYVDAANNSVGIGTTDASNAKLTITGTGNPVGIGDEFGYTGIKFYGAQNGQLEIFNTRGNTSFGNIIFKAGSSESMRIQHGGNVGIGTTSPDYKLHIKETTTAAKMYINGENGSVTSSLLIGRDARNWEIKTDTATNLYKYSLSYIGTDSPVPDIFTALNNGNVGIGETSPDNKLHIVDTSAGAVTYPLRLQNSGTTVGTDVGLIFTTKTSGGGSASSVIRSESEDTSGNSSLVFTTPSGGSTAERMRIESDGTVQITNSTSPKLQLKRGAKEYTTRVDNANKFVIQEEGGNEFFIVESGASSNSIRIDNSGNVGIGTTGPSGGAVGGKVLHLVNSGGTASVRVDRSDASTAGTLSITSGNTSNSIYSTGNKPLNISTNSTTRMHIDGSGNIGVGVTPESWTTDGNTRAIQISTGGALWEAYDGVFLSNNIYFDGATKYIASQAASRIDLSSTGEFRFFNAPSGTADATVSLERRMTIDSSGQVGIGTDNPSHRLNVYHPTTNVVARFESGDPSAWIDLQDNQSGTYGVLLGAQGTDFVIAPNNDEAVRVLESGNVGINQTNPSSGISTSSRALHISHSNVASIALDNTTENAKFDIASLNISGGVLSIRKNTSSGTSAATELMRINGSGNVTIGSVTSAYKLYVYDNNNRTEATASFSIRGSGYNAFHWLDGTAYYIGQNSSSRGLRMYSGAETAGVGLSAGATSWGSYSDERLKENIEDLGLVSDKIKNIRCITYNRNDIEDSKKTIGFIAQDFVGKFDEVLDKSKIKEDGEEYYSIKYTETIPILLKAIQELKADNDSLRARIETLENN